MEIKLFLYSPLPYFLPLNFEEPLQKTTVLLTLRRGVDKTMVLWLCFSSMCGWSEHCLFLKASLEIRTELSRDEML